MKSRDDDQKPELTWFHISLIALGVALAVLLAAYGGHWIGTIIYDLQHPKHL
jgi:hypothetical protein